MCPLQIPTAVFFFCHWFEDGVRLSASVFTVLQEAKHTHTHTHTHAHAHTHTNIYDYKLLRGFRVGGAYSAYWRACQYLLKHAVESRGRLGRLVQSSTNITAPIWRTQILCKDTSVYIPWTTTEGGQRHVDTELLYIYIRRNPRRKRSPHCTPRLLKNTGTKEKKKKDKELKTCGTWTDS